MDAVVNDRSGHAKSRSSNFFLAKIGGGATRKFPDDQVKLCEFLARKAFPKYKFQLAVLFRKKRQIALGTTHVARKNHLAP
jgi:hypothetical protein